MSRANEQVDEAELFERRIVEALFDQQEPFGEHETRSSVFVEFVLPDFSGLETTAVDEEDGGAHRFRGRVAVHAESHAEFAAVDDVGFDDDLFRRECLRVPCRHAHAADQSGDEQIEQSSPHDSLLVVLSGRAASDVSAAPS